MCRGYGGTEIGYPHQSRTAGRPALDFIWILAKGIARPAGFAPDFLLIFAVARCRLGCLSKRQYLRYQSCTYLDKLILSPMCVADGFFSWEMAMVLEVASNTAVVINEQLVEKRTKTDLLVNGHTVYFDSGSYVYPGWWTDQVTYDSMHAGRNCILLYLRFRVNWQAGVTADEFLVE